MSSSPHPGPATSRSGGSRSRAGGQRDRRRSGRGPGARSDARPTCYLISTVAPCSSSVAFMSAASALLPVSLTLLGVPSPRSLASLRPSPVSSRTTLMTWIFLSPAPVSTTSNSVCSSTAAAPPPPPPIGIAIMGAAAVTPNLSSYFFFNSDSSSTVMLPMRSSTWSMAVDILEVSFWMLPGSRVNSVSRSRRPARWASGPPGVGLRFSGCLLSLLLEHVGHHGRESQRRIDRGEELGHRRDEDAEDLGQQNFPARQGRED